MTKGEDFHENKNCIRDVSTYLYIWVKSCVPSVFMEGALPLIFV